MSMYYSRFIRHKLVLFAQDTIEIISSLNILVRVQYFIIFGLQKDSDFFCLFIELLIFF
jgi:hypothetical protein